MWATINDEPREQGGHPGQRMLSMRVLVLSRCVVTKRGRSAWPKTSAWPALIAASEQKRVGKGCGSAHGMFDQVCYLRDGDQVFSSALISGFD
jgi:hypothetical protein